MKTTGLQLRVLDQVPAQPWRNGGGVTHELWAWPEGQEWQLRVSVAEVAKSGPFSAFAGVRRWFAVVQGSGVELQFATGTLRATTASEPLVFDGATAPGCTLIAGPTLDLNMMVVQGSGDARMSRAAAGESWQDPAPLRAVYSARAAELFVNGRHVATLPAHALACTASAAGETWQLGPEGSAPRAWWLAFEPVSPSR